MSGFSKLYEVETRALKQQVRRNLERFPDDFMFILNTEEIEYLVSQNVIANKRTSWWRKSNGFYRTRSSNVIMCT